MKLTKNEKKVLIELLDNSRTTDIDIAKKLKITSQAVGKIRRKLEKNGIIKAYDLQVDLEKIGINIMTIAMIKLLPEAWKKGVSYLKDREDKSPQVITSMLVPKADFSMIVLYGFKNMVENDKYFNELQMKHPEVEVTDTFTLSIESVIKHSMKDLVKETLQRGEEMVKPLPFEMK